jgi:hypothetical protein
MMERLPQLGQVRWGSVLMDLTVLWSQSEPKATSRKTKLSAARFHSGRIISRFFGLLKPSYSGNPRHWMHSMNGHLPLRPDRSLLLDLKIPFCREKKDDLAGDAVLHRTDSSYGSSLFGSLLNLGGKGLSDGSTLCPAASEDILFAITDRNAGMCNL